MDLAYDRRGSGEPLVLLHGVGHRRQGWDAVIDRLATERDVIAVDLPGHGDSPDPHGGPHGDLHRLADGVQAFLTSLGLQRPHVAGNSLGGLIALELGARDGVRSVTALSPAAYWNRVEHAYAIGVLRAANAVGSRLSPAAVRRVVGFAPSRLALFGLLFGRPGRHAHAELAMDLTGLGRPRETFFRVLDATGGYRPPAPPRVPTTIGWGTRDLLLPRWQALRARRLMPDSQVYFLPGCGHAPMADDPALVAGLLLAGSRG